MTQQYWRRRFCTLPSAPPLVYPDFTFHISQKTSSKSSFLTSQWEMHETCMIIVLVMIFFMQIASKLAIHFTIIILIQTVKLLQVLHTFLLQSCQPYGIHFLMHSPGRFNLFHKTLQNPHNKMLLTFSSINCFYFWCHSWTELWPSTLTQISMQCIPPIFWFFF